MNNNIIIQSSSNNTVIQEGDNSTCIINGKKYVNGVEVKYDYKQERINNLLHKLELIKEELKNLGYETETN